MGNKLLTRRLLTAWSAGLAAAATLLATPAMSEDIDLFRSIRGDEPSLNVLVIVDNTANWDSTLPLTDASGATKTSKRVIEHEVLQRVFGDGRYQNRLNVGFMVFSDENTDGGKLILPVEELTSEYASQLSDYFGSGLGNKKGGMPKSNNAAYALVLEEALRVFNAEEPRAGKDSGASGKIQPGKGAIGEGGKYNRPSPIACYDYVVMLANGEPDNGENSGNTPNVKLAERGGDTSRIDLAENDFENIVADEYGRFFGQTDVNATRDGVQNLPIHVLDVFDAGNVTPDDPFKNLSNKERGARSLMQSIAKQSKGSYALATNAARLEEELRAILDKLTSVDSIFAAASLPVSVNTRGTHLNQFYVGVFRPNARNSTQWNGNLKKYKIGGGENNNVFVVDRANSPALDEETGFVQHGAKSFWTGESVYWSFDPRGVPASVSDLPDGPLVEKGGVAQQLRQLGDNSNPPDGNAEGNKSYSSFRNIFTCTGCKSGDALSATPFSTRNAALTKGVFAVDSRTEADLLINWVRGEDNFVDSDNFPADEDKDGRRNDARASLHGDVLHSQPAVVNYSGSDDENETDVVIFYGANDGMLHAVKGGPDGGQELWAFVPEEMFPELRALRENVPGKKYFVDGDMTTFTIDNNRDGFINGDDRVLLFATMRRGGRFVYAFDVTDPAAPTYLWRVTNKTAGFSELGQTWSDVRVGYVDGLDNPVAVFAAGYDAGAEDAPKAGESRAARSQGRGLYMVDAITGSLIWQAGPNPDASGGGETLTVSGMTHSMPAAPTLIDFNSDGLLDRIYIPDTGGQVWRINLSADGFSQNVSPALWSAHLLASVGADQKFLEAVDVVEKKTTSADGDQGGYDAILVGSGDRTDPFNQTTVNRFYMIKDRGQDSPQFDRDDLFDATSNVIQDGKNEATRQAAINSLLQSQGWYITLQGKGEKVVTGATTAVGVTFFNTNQPPEPPAEGLIDCANAQGIARGYAVSFEDATALTEQDGTSGLTRPDRVSEYAGGGFPPTPTIFLVEIDGKQYLGAASGFVDRDLPSPKIHVRERTFYMNDRIDK